MTFIKRYAIIKKIPLRYAMKKNNFISKDALLISGKEFMSRLFMGTGKFSSVRSMKESIEASGTEMVTVALRRVELDNPKDNLLSAIDMSKYLLLPNTSGARDAVEAVRLARLSRAANCGNWVKLEVTPDPRYLLPDPVETLKAAETLIKDGFIVLPYINADPILARRLEDIGAAAVMPLGSPIGSNQGLQTKASIEIIIEQSSVPVVVDAGLGSPSHAAEAMEMGASAVLVNTAIAVAGEPAEMARAFKKGVEAGRLAFLSGIAGESKIASATSPLAGIINE